MKVREINAILVMFPIAAGAAIAGPDWIEDGDAGSTLMTSQDTTAVGQIRTLAGVIEGPQNGDSEDVYRVRVESADTFDNLLSFGLRADTQFDAALWLFDAQGFGVLANDNSPFSEGNDAALTVPSSDGVTVALPPGNYFLAITESGNVPLGFLSDFGLGDTSDQLVPIFEFDSDREISGPDGPAAGSPLAGWSGLPQGEGMAGGYGINITPTPASALTLGFASVFASRRRRA